MAIWNTILDLIFPAKCLVCGESGKELCSGCLSVSPPAERESAEWVFPLFDYRYPPIKRAVWLLKYKNKKGIAKSFAEVMYGRMLEELGELSVMENFRNVLLIPIPLSKARLRERRFNQAELLAEALTALDEENKSFELQKNILIKPRETEHQARIENRNERLKNILGSFAVQNAEQVAGRNIILIDDVTTTGATLTEAKKVLQEAGARKIIAFTLAH